MGRRGPEMTNRRNLLHKEPAVIDQDVIIDALKKLLPKGTEGKYARESGIDPKKAEALFIEFQSISQIANVSHMLNLRKLVLSNNVINKIDHLDELENLEELDLSFNSIKKLEGLGNLRKLKILNLHRNLISIVENLDNNLRLEVFVCSTNGFKNFDNIRHLRRLVRLRALNLDGNPMCDDPDYRNFVLALLPDLLILDYVRIKPKERSFPGVLQFRDRILEIAASEDGMRRRASVVEASEELQLVYKEAMADGFNGEEFWNAIYEKDIGWELIGQIPGAEAIRQNKQDEMSKICRELFVDAMRSYTRRKNEYNAFETAVKEIKDEVIGHGRHLTEEFLQFSQNTMQKIKPVMSQLEAADRKNGGTMNFRKGKIPSDYVQLQEHLTTLVTAYVKKLHKLWYCLMTAEIELNEQITEVGRELERVSLTLSRLFRKRVNSL